MTDTPLTPAENMLIEANIRLVHACVGGWRNRLPGHFDLDELQSVGSAGLIAAARNHKPELGKFAGYAWRRINFAIMDALRRSDFVPRRDRHRLRLLRAKQTELEQTLGREVSAEEIAANVSADPDEYASNLAALNHLSPCSLDEQCGEYGLTIGGTIPDPSDVLARDAMVEAETKDQLTAELERLPERQRKVLSMAYLEGMSGVEIGAAMGLSDARINQIKFDALRVLKRRMQTEPKKPAKKIEEPTRVIFAPIPMTPAVVSESAAAGPVEPESIYGERAWSEDFRVICAELEFWKAKARR